MHASECSIAGPANRLRRTQDRSLRRRVAPRLAYALTSTEAKRRRKALKEFMVGAYGVQSNMIFGGPKWLDSDRFDIIAKAPDPT
jgi:uncharacterized protein (TIGR03435 family)